MGVRGHLLCQSAADHRSFNPFWKPSEYSTKDTEIGFCYTLYMCVTVAFTHIQSNHRGAQFTMYKGHLYLAHTVGRIQGHSSYALCVPESCPLSPCLSMSLQQVVPRLTEHSMCMWQYVGGIAMWQRRLCTCIYVHIGPAPLPPGPGKSYRNARYVWGVVGVSLGAGKVCAIYRTIWGRRLTTQSKGP